MYFSGDTDSQNILIILSLLSSLILSDDNNNNSNNNNKVTNWISTGNFKFIHSL